MSVLRKVLCLGSCWLLGAPSWAAAIDESEATVIPFEKINIARSLTCVVDAGGAKPVTFVAFIVQHAADPIPPRFIGFQELKSEKVEYQFTLENALKTVKWNGSYERSVLFIHASGVASNTVGISDSALLDIEAVVADYDQDLMGEESDSTQSSITIRGSGFSRSLDKCVSKPFAEMSDRVGKP